LCRNIARGSAQWPRAQAALARAYLYFQQENKAVELMREVTRVFPTSPGAHNDLGNVLYRLGRLSEAAPCYRTALKLDPHYVTARYNLAMVLKEQGQALEAIEQLRRMLELDTVSTGALFELATLLETTDQIADAQRTCSRLLEIAPRDARGYSLGATLLDRLDDPRAALELLRRGHEQIPEDVEITRGLAWRLATAAHPEIRDGEEAVRLAEELVGAAGTDDPQALDVLAAAYAQAGRFVDAVHTARRAVERADKLGLATLAAEITMRLNLYEDGKPYYRP
jgi:spermidine synthase